MGLGTFCSTTTVFIGGIWSTGDAVDSALSQMVATNRDFKDRTFEQGIYKIVGDAIVARYINAGYSNSWAVYESRFRIIDENTLAELELLVLDKHPSRMGNFAAGLAKFVPVKEIPKSSSWLKEKEWFYCNDPTQKSK